MTDSGPLQGNSANARYVSRENVVVSGGTGPGVSVGGGGGRRRIGGTEETEGESEGLAGK